MKKEFLDELEKIALELAEGKSGALSELRKLERKLYLAEIYREWDAKEVGFLAYFIKQIVGIIWRNFAVDASIELTRSQLEAMSKKIGTFIIEVTSSLEKDEIDGSYKAFSLIINELYSSIIQADETLYMGK